MAQQSILERTVVHAGQILIHAGMPQSNAYLIQSGEIIAYVNHNNKRLEIGRFGPGTMIGEASLMTEETSSASYEAAVDTTVIAISSHDFQKTLTKADPLVKNVFKHMVHKLKKMEASSIAAAEKNANVDEEAYQIVQYLIRNLDDTRRMDYEQAMLPHFNDLVLVLRSVQEKHRHEIQRKGLEKLQASLGDDEAAKDGAPAPDPAVPDTNTFTAAYEKDQDRTEAPA